MGCNTKDDCYVPERENCMKVTLHSGKEYTRCIPSDYVEIASMCISI
jgi:hypothetical protein